MFNSMTECMFKVDQRYSFEFWFFQTPLHSAAANGKLDVVEILLRNGANINEKNVRNFKKWEVEEEMKKLREYVKNLKKGFKS